MKTVLISDFDGTITKKDFFEYVIDELLTPDVISAWDDYKQKKINHIQALNKIFNKVRLSKKEFIEFINSFESNIETDFLKTIDLCREKNIDFYVISAGSEYYINILFEKLNIKDKVTLISNPGKYSQEKGLELFWPDKDSGYYSANYGIDKKAAAENIIKDYDFSLFAGDGVPDLKIAKLTDVIFARSSLACLCRENDLKYNDFGSYKEIYDYIKELK